MMASRRARLVLLVGLLFAGTPHAVSAQRGQDAGLVGIVRDGSGAVIANATITASSPQLIGGPQAAATDAEGIYRFAFLPPGRYDIVAERTGFKSATRSGVVMVPGATFTVDFRLEVARMNETVTVEGPVPIVDVHTSASPAFIDRTLLENLPLSRSVSDAVNLAPGVIRDVAFGGSVRSNPLTIDGTNGNEPGWGTPTVTPNLNWIDEIQIVSTGADAQFGEFSGALENAITRSGSNTFSGLADFWSTRPSWSGNNRGSLSPLLQQRFRPIEIVQRWDSDVQVGGPVVRDRLWFFAGGEAYRNAYRPLSFSGLPRTADEPITDGREPKAIVKLTSALAGSIRAEGYLEHDTQTITAANAGPLVRPEATSRFDRSETMWNAQLLWTLSSRAFVQIRHGGHSAGSYGGAPEDRRAGPPGHSDSVTGVMSQNVASYSQFLSRPNTTRGQLTYFTTGGGRSHEIRVGGEYEHARLLQAGGYTGGMLFRDANGQPDTVFIAGDTMYRPTYGRRTVYVQDAWSATDRLTVNAGVRGGFYTGSVPDRGHVFSSSSLSPRLGVAWDVDRDHRTVVRGHYGRYHDEMVTTFFDFLDPLSQGTTIIAQVVGPNQYVPITQTGSTLNGRIDPDVKMSFSEEFMAAVERQLPGGISARAQFVRKDFKDTIGFIDNTRVWQPVERIDPGPDGIVGTADDTGPITIFFDVDPTLATPVQTNPAGAYRRYTGAQFVVSKRNARALDFQASYTWSRTVGSYNNSFSSNAGTNDLSPNGVFVNPNRALNAEGRTPQDFPHEVKVLGTYRLQRWGGLNVSGVYRYQSGRIWARSVAFGPQTQLVAITVEPRGARQLDAVNTLDLRIEKTWKPSNKTTIGAFADVFNVANAGIALGVNNLSGPNFALPTQWLDPRTVRAGIRLVF